MVRGIEVEGVVDGDGCGVRYVVALLWWSCPEIGRAHV